MDHGDESMVPAEMVGSGSPLTFVGAGAAGFASGAMTPTSSAPMMNNANTAPGTGSRLSNFSIGSSEEGGQYLEAPMLPVQANGSQSPISVRPFSLTETFAFPKPPNSASGEAPNPFVDSASASGEPLVPGVIVPEGEAAQIQTIRRPFAPTLSDELAVATGDQIRIVHMFDDGWAQVEKVTGAGVGNAGLIPIDCLREEDEELPSFLSKRMSSYMGTGPQ